MNKTKYNYDEFEDLLIGDNPQAISAQIDAAIVFMTRCFIRTGGERLMHELEENVENLHEISYFIKNLELKKSKE